MIRYLLAALLCAASAPVCARVQIEVGAGIAQASPRSDGTWYQQRYPHTLGLSSPVGEINLRWQIHPSIDLVTGVVDMGRYSSNSQDNPNDAAYAAHVNLPLVNYIGSGRLWGVQALLEHTWGDRWQFGVQGGPLVYRESWRMDVPDWYPSDPVGTRTWYTPRATVGGYNLGPVVPIHTRSQQWSIGGVIGVTLRYRDFPAALSLRYYRDGASFGGHQGSWPPIWKSHVTMMVSWRF